LTIVGSGGGLKASVLNFCADDLSLIIADY